MIADVESERRGAFAVLARHPLVSALVLPSSGLGIWAVLEYFGRQGAGLP
jgi:hypothetical protein